MAEVYSTTRLVLYDSYFQPLSTYTAVDPNYPQVVVGINSFSDLELNLLTNDAGELRVDLLGYLDKTKIGDDYRIEVWSIKRDTVSGQEHQSLVGNTQWLIYGWQFEHGADRVRRTHIQARAAITLVDFRPVMYTDNYNAVSSETYLNIPMDNIMKKAVTTNFVSPTASLCTILDGVTNIMYGRNISAYLQVQGLTGQAPAKTLQTSWKFIGKLCRDLCASSETAGIPLFFNIVMGVTTAGTRILEFRTYINQLGSDRTAVGGNPLWFSDRSGDFIEEKITTSYDKNKNMVVALGKNDGRSRVATLSIDTVQIDRSAFGPKIDIVVDKKANTVAELQATGDKALRAARPLRTGEGRILSRPGKAFEVDFYHGDKCMADLNGDQFPVRIDAVNMKVKSRKAIEITAIVRREDNL